MSLVRKRRGRVELSVDADESAMLVSLVEQVAGLLEGDARPPSDDPFALWQAEFAAPVVLDRDDPVIVRLFPDAYPDDEVASDEFRRLTQSRQRSERLSNAGVVLAALKAGVDGKPVVVESGDLSAWLKTLTSVRLSLGVRLGIESDADLARAQSWGPQDPRSFAYRVYEWISYIQEELLS